MILPRIVGVFFSLALLWGCSRLVGNLFVYFRQPRTVGEIISGVLLGPTVWGSDTFVFIPQEVYPELRAFAFFAIMCYTSIIGLGFDYRQLKGKVLHVILFTVLSIGMPCALAFVSFDMVFSIDSLVASQGKVTPISVYFSFASAFSLTALPVVFSICRERGIDILLPDYSQVLFGTCAFITFFMFLFLGLSENFANQLPPVKSAVRIILMLALLVLMAAVQFVWTALAEKLQWMKKYTPNLMVFHITMVAASGALSIYTGFGPLLGPFVYAAFLPFLDSIRVDLRHRFEETVQVIFLPIFMSFNGLQANFRLIQPDHIVFVVSFVLLGIASKVLIAPVARIIRAQPTYQAGMTAAFLNCRGPLALVVGSQAVNNKVITSAAFGAYVVLSVVSTLLTNPLVDFSLRFKPHDAFEAVEEDKLKESIIFAVGKIGKTVEETGARPLIKGLFDLQVDTAMVLKDRTDRAETVLAVLDRDGEWNPVSNDLSAVEDFRKLTTPPVIPSAIEFQPKPLDPIHLGSFSGEGDHFVKIMDEHELEYQSRSQSKLSAVRPQGAISL